MTVWEINDALGDEETKHLINDGSLTSLYEVVKLAYLEPAPEESPIRIPPISSSVSYGFVSISLGSSVFIFDENCSSLVLTLTLGSAIDVMLWLPGGKFLLLTDSSGMLHCLFIEAKKVVFTRKLTQENAKDHKPLFTGAKSFVTSEETQCVVLVSSSGTIFRLDGIETESLEEGFKAKDIPFLTSLRSKMSLTLETPFPEDSIVLCSDSMSLGSTELCVWVGMENGIYFWSSESIHSSEPVVYPLDSVTHCIDLCIVMMGRYLVALDNFGNLRILCAYSGVVIWVGKSEKLKENVECVQVLNSGHSSTQLLLLLKSHEDTGSSFCSLNIPDFECSHMVSVSEHVHLLRLGIEADAITYLEPEFSVTSPDNRTVSRLKLKSVVDRQPEIRLAKLLAKHKFNDAEEFCGTFNLDVVEVMKAKAKFLCELMSPWKRLSGDSTVMEPYGDGRHFEELMRTLGRITDDEFVATLCINAPLSDLAPTGHLLSYAKERLGKTSKSGADDQLCQLMQKVSKCHYWLFTFLSIFPSTDVHHWLSFSHTDMFQEFLNHLGKGNLDVAATIWHRHQFEFLPNVDEACLSLILNTIPTTIPSERLCSWLPKHLFKEFIKLCPAAIDLIASWTDERIKLLELVEKQNWPLNGYNLVTVTIDAIEKVGADFSLGGDIEVQLAVYMAQWKAHSPSSALYHLRQTALALTDLLLLAEKFFVKIKFKDYNQDDKCAVVGALLDWVVSGDDVEPLVKGFLNTFTLRHGLKLDQVLESYVMNSISHSDYVWWLHGEAPWEDKAYAVIRIISDAQIKVRCIVECVRIAPVPWSKGTREICAEGMALNTPFTLCLLEQERLSKLKIVLQRHKLHLINYQERRNEAFILRTIVSHEGDVMEDALKTVSAFNHVSTLDAYYYRIIHLLRIENYSEAKKILSNLNEELLISTCKLITSYISQQLALKPIGIKCREKLKCLTSGVLALMDIIDRDLMRYSKLSDVLTKIACLNTLQIKYDLFLSLDDLKNEDFCLWTLKNFLADLNNSSKKEITPPNRDRTATSITAHTRLRIGNNTLHQTGKTFRTAEVTNEFSLDTVDENLSCMWKDLHKIEHISNLLGISRQRLYTLLSSLSCQKGEFSFAVQAARLLTNLPDETDSTYTIQTIFHLIKAVIDWPQKEEMNDSKSLEAYYQSRNELRNLIYYLIAPSVLSCKPDKWVMLNDIGTLLFLSERLYSQCHFSGIYAKDDTNSDDPYVKWNFSCMFTDSSMPIEESIITQTLTQILSRVYLIYSLENVTGVFKWNTNLYSIYEDEKTLAAFSTLTQHLQERSQDLLNFFVSKHVCSSLASCGKSQNFSSWKKSTRNLILTLLKKIINSNQRHLSFAVSLLTHLIPKEGLRIVTEVIKRLGYDFLRLHLVGEIGYDFSCLHNLIDIKRQFFLMNKKASWGKRMAALGISFNAAFSGDVKALKAVLKQLTSQPQCNFAILQEFCEDFSWDLTEALIYYFRFSLRNLDTTPSIGLEQDGSLFSQAISTSEIKKLKEIAFKIDASVTIRNVLKEEINALSSYNYEMLDVALTLLVEFETDNLQEIKTKRNLLNFLRTYSRCSEPGEEECKRWSSQNDCTPLPPIAKSRLPFHEICSKETSVLTKLLEHEFNLNNVDKWISIGFSLRLTEDQIYFLTAQNIVSSTLKKETQSSEWQIQSSYGNLLTDVQNIIVKIKHHELRAASANWVVKQLPPGADKVEAARMCALLAVHTSMYDKNNTQSSSISKFENRYHNLAIEHILHKHRLAISKYLSLKTDPMTLISRLYEHPSLSSLATLNAEHRIDINGCVKEICEVMNYNLVSIQLQILSRWLPMSENLNEDEDETVSNFNLVLDPMAADYDADNLSEHSLSRIIYLLRSYPQEQSVSYLLNQALSQNKAIRTSVRLKALRCLLAIADHEAIQKQTILSLDDIRKMLQTLTYVHRLESFGHTISSDIFDSMNKDALVEGIWRAQRHNPEALQLLVDICYDFKISTASLWEALLDQLIKLTKIGKITISALENILLRVRNLAYLWLLPPVTSAWEMIIYEPFRKADQPLSEDCLIKCARSVNLLIQSCPVDIPVEPLIKLCLTLDLPILALAVSAKLHDKEDQIQKIFKKYPKEKLTSQYQEVKEMLVLPQNVEELLSVN